MKHCPKCDREYYDESLNFCLEDGETLLPADQQSEAATAIQLAASPTDAPTKRIQLSEIKLPERSSSRRAYFIGGAIGIFALLALAAGIYFYSGPTASKQIDSIAVLPFQNAGGNSDAEYLSDGIAESLINNLTELQQLKVTARSTAFRYKGKDIDPLAIGRDLNVRAVLMGSVRQIGDKLNVQVDLIDTSNGAQLWGNEYERGLADVISVKQSIAREVVERLKLRLTGEQQQQLVRRDTTNPEAYQLYLKGRYFWGRRSPDTIKKAIEYFEQAIGKDPGFALAYAGLADAYVVPATRIPPREAMPKAKAAAMRALEIDNTLAEAHTSLARVLQVYDWNWKEAEREYKRAIELNPRYAVAHQWYGGYLERSGDINGGIAERKIALELDPLSAITTFELGSAYFYAGDYDRALALYQKALELEPNFPAALQFEPLVYVQRGLLDQAIAKVNEAPERADLASTGVLGYVYAVAGRTRDARIMADELIRRRGDEYISPVSIALIFAGLGDRDQTFQWLETGYEERAFQMQFLKLDPRWAGVRNDARFADLTSRIGP
jgi:TolB-like protein